MHQARARRRRGDGQSAAAPGMGQAVHDHQCGHGTAVLFEVCHRHRAAPAPLQRARRGALRPRWLGPGLDGGQAVARADHGVGVAMDRQQGRSIEHRPGRVGGRAGIVGRWWRRWRHPGSSCLQRAMAGCAPVRASAHAPVPLFPLRGPDSSGRRAGVRHARPRPPCGFVFASVDDGQVQGRFRVRDALKKTLDHDGWAKMTRRTGASGCAGVLRVQGGESLRRRS